MSRRSMKQSFASAISGVIYTVIHERNMKIHTLAALAVIGFAFYLHISRIEWGLLIVTIFSVIIAETINTAVENAVDLATSDYHPLARLAKNIAAGAVLLSAINAVIIAFIIFGPYLF